MSFAPTVMAAVVTASFRRPIWTLKDFWVTSQPSTSLLAWLKDLETLSTRSLKPSVFSPVSWSVVLRPMAPPVIFLMASVYV